LLNPEFSNKILLNTTEEWSSEELFLFYSVWINSKYQNKNQTENKGLQDDETDEQHAVEDQEEDDQEVETADIDQDSSSPTKKIRYQKRVNNLL